MTRKKRPATEPAAGTGRKKVRRPPGSPEERALSALGEIFRDAWRRFGTGRPPAGDLELDIRLRFSSGRPPRALAEPALSSQVEAEVREAAAREDVYQAGRVYCYRCESSGCPHGYPSEPRKVFAGYSSTGQPRWEDFARFLIEKRHPDADIIFLPRRRGLSSLFLAGEDLRSGQLPVFGRTSKTYAILGQVALGYLQATLPEGEPLRAALSVQAVEVRGRGRRPGLMLNVIGRLPDGTETIDALEGWRHDRFFGAFSSARRQLSRVALPAGGRRRSPAEAEGMERRIGAILKKMAKTLQRTGRQGQRRTDHAEERQHQRRPTAKAVEDAAAAGDDRLLRDDREGTVVVIGPRGRVHVFSPEGRQITSLAMRREEIDGRKRRRRWQPLADQGRRRFRAGIEALRKNA